MTPQWYKWYKWQLEKDKDGMYLQRTKEEIEAMRKECNIPEDCIDLVEGVDFEIIKPKQLTQ